MDEIGKCNVSNWRKKNLINESKLFSKTILSFSIFFKKSQDCELNVNIMECIGEGCNGKVFKAVYNDKMYILWLIFLLS